MIKTAMLIPVNSVARKALPGPGNFADIESFVETFSDDSVAIKSEDLVHRDMAHSLSRERERFIGGEAKADQMPAWQTFNKSAIAIKGFAAKLDELKAKLPKAILNYKAALNGFLNSKPEILGATDSVGNPQVVKDVQDFAIAA